MYINEAFKLAQMTDGQTGRNPAVGCIIVSDGTIIGIGAHLKEGSSHAEVQALAMADDARGATLYCTLEPCSHYGKTPPCIQAIVEAGISRVVFAARDTSLDNTGIAYMEAHGIEVIHEPHDDITAFYAPFFQAKKDSACYVTVKLATTLDGKLADDSDSSKWLTNAASRTDVHKLRHTMDGVLVGRRTYELDRPKLDARHVSGKKPAKIIISKSGDVKLHAADVDSEQRIIIITSRELETTAEVIVTDDLSPGHITKLLYKHGIRRLLVEGGSSVITEFIEHDCFDEVVLYYAPKLLGGTERNRFYHTEEKELSALKQLELKSVDVFQHDVKLTYRKGQNDVHRNY